MSALSFPRNCTETGTFYCVLITKYIKQFRASETVVRAEFTVKYVENTNE